MNDANWHAEHRAFQDGYAAGFLRAFKLVRDALDLKKELDYEQIKKEFESYKNKEVKNGSGKG